MFGNLVNNRQLLKLLEEHQIRIEPFVEKALGTANYPLHPNRVLNRQPDGKWVPVHSFADDPNPFHVPANAYVIVEAREVIRLETDGIIGHFIPASNLIEQGFGITCGKIDKKYGTTGGERLRFGMKNLLPEPNPLSAQNRVVHVEFFDLRSLACLTANLSDDEFQVRLRRALRQIEDGVYYPENE
jgi:deoxycytidine triphosphate deaminase